MFHDIICDKRELLSLGGGGGGGIWYPQAHRSAGECKHRQRARSAHLRSASVNSERGGKRVRREISRELIEHEGRKYWIWERSSREWRSLGEEGERPRYKERERTRKERLAEDCVDHYLIGFSWQRGCKLVRDKCNIICITYMCVLHICCIYVTRILNRLIMLVVASYTLVMCVCVTLVIVFVKRGEGESHYRNWDGRNNLE